MTAQKSYGHNNLWAVGWIAVIFDKMASRYFWWSFGMPQPLKNNGGGGDIIFSLFFSYILDGLTWKYLHTCPFLDTANIRLCIHIHLEEYYV